MADTGPAAAYLAEARAVTDAATKGPWEADDDEDCWRLFGAVTGILHPMQLIKAPKHGTPYAEYWPNEADAAFIVASRSFVPRLLAAVEAVLARHERFEYPSRAICRECRQAWPCEDVQAITRELLGKEA
jgi:hypothetical protein